MADRVVITAADIDKLRLEANTERLAGAQVMAALLDPGDAAQFAAVHGYRLVGGPSSPPAAASMAVDAASVVPLPAAPEPAPEPEPAPQPQPAPEPQPAAAAAPEPAVVEAVPEPAPAPARPVATAPEAALAAAEVQEPAAAAPIGRRSPGRPGAVVSVYSPSGGAGTSMLAGTLAASIARRGLRTLLVDLDLQNGNQAFYFEVANLKRYSLLGLKPLIDEIAIRCAGNPALIATEAPRVLSEDLLINHVFRRDDLHVLCALEDPAAVDDYVDPATHIETLVQVLTAHFDVVVFDLPNTVDTFTAPALFNSERVVVVSGPDVPSQVKVARMINMVLAPMMEARAHDLAERCLLVLNRGKSKTDVPMPIPVAVGLPNDTKWAEEFIRRHGSLPAKAGGYMKTVDQLVGRLGVTAEAPR